MKKYYGILITVFYALIFRVLVEINLLEINSWTYIIIIPIIMGYLPFVFDKKVFIESKLKSILFPLTSVILFLLIAFITRLEDLGCFIILFPPFLIISIIFSLIVRSLLKMKKDTQSKNITRNSLMLIAIPLLVGNIEKYVDKKESNFEITQSIIINNSKQPIWNNLFSVPNLNKYIDVSIYNYFGFPNPIKSDYNSETNTRLGYFTNGIILNENISEEKKLEKLTFTINVEKSNFNESQTFKHVLKNKNLVFNSITYKVKSISNKKTELTLICNYNIKSNLSFYGEFWSKNIIIDFENKLLKALKKRNEE